MCVGITVIHLIVNFRHWFPLVGKKRWINPAVLALCIVFSYRVACEAAESRANRDYKLTTGAYFSASEEKTAFHLFTGPRSSDAVIVDRKSKTIKRLTSRGTRLLYPFLSIDGQRLLLVRQHADTGQSELLSCVVDSYVCRELFNSADSIADPVELDKDRVVYISSPLSEFKQRRSRYVRHDIWLFNGERSRRIADLQFYELRTLCFTSSSVYFSAMGPRSGKEIIPESIALQPASSDIYSLPFDRSTGSIAIPDKRLSPLFMAKGISTSVSVVTDESFAAFLRADRTRVGGYRYDLIVQNLKTGASRPYESKGFGFSRPVVVGHTVVVNDLLDDRYVIKSLLPEIASLKTEVEVTDDEIARLPVTEITVENESR